MLTRQQLRVVSNIFTKPMNHYSSLPKQKYTVSVADVAAMPAIQNQNTSIGRHTTERKREPHLSQQTCDVTNRTETTQNHLKLVWAATQIVHPEKQSIHLSLSQNTISILPLSKN